MIDLKLIVSSAGLLGTLGVAAMGYGSLRTTVTVHDRAIETHGVALNKLNKEREAHAIEIQKIDDSLETLKDNTETARDMLRKHGETLDRLEALMRHAR